MVILIFFFFPSEIYNILYLIPTKLGLYVSLRRILCPDVRPEPHIRAESFLRMVFRISIGVENDRTRHGQKHVRHNSTNPSFRTSEKTLLEHPGKTI